MGLLELAGRAASASVLSRKRVAPSTHSPNPRIVSNKSRRPAEPCPMPGRPAGSGSGWRLPRRGSRPTRTVAQPWVCFTSASCALLCTCDLARPVADAAHELAVGALVVGGAIGRPCLVCRPASSSALRLSATPPVLWPDGEACRPPPLAADAGAVPTVEDARGSEHVCRAGL